MDLKDFFKQNNTAAVAFSGGTDSSYLLYAAKKYADEISAYYVKTAFQPAFELDDAEKLASILGVGLTVIRLDILAENAITSNPEDRCYHCKKKIFTAIAERAAGDGFDTLLDGTNASDDPGDRPGTKALKELNVLSPLRECGLTKADVRALSKEAGLFTWDKPAYACLATRIPHGTAINADLLKKTEESEDHLRSLGFKDLRVRTLGNTAKIEISSDQLSLLTERRKDIVRVLSRLYENVTLDMVMRDEK